MAETQAIKHGPNFKDITGQKFGRLTVEAYSGIDKKHQALWQCRCECGNAKVVRASGLKSGRTKSCGCLIGKANITHGCFGTPEYGIWSGMMSRCTNPKHTYYSRYGGRGIKVCERWNSFVHFLEDMGLRPSPEHTIDRYPNGDGNYEPGNVRWATMAEQNRNHPNVKLITFNGETLCLREWASRTGLDRTTIAFRIKAGWTVERALTTPARH